MRKWGFKPLEIMVLFSPKALGLFSLLAWEISKESCSAHISPLPLNLNLKDNSHLGSIRSSIRRVIHFLRTAELVAGRVNDDSSYRNLECSVTLVRCAETDTLSSPLLLRIQIQRSGLILP